MASLRTVHHQWDADVGVVLVSRRTPQGPAATGVRVGAIEVRPRAFRGRPVAFGVEPRPSARTLDWRAVKVDLPVVVPARQHCELVVITDLSASMTGGHDVTGCRHEAVALAVDHIAAKGAGRWTFRSLSFDLASALDVPATVLDRRGVRAVEAAMLTKPRGSTSNLAQSLAAAIRGRSGDPAVLVVLSDFELTDADPQAMLHRFAASGFDEQVAVVFRSPVPPALHQGGVTAVHVDPAVDAPATVAAVVVDATNRLAAKAIGTSTARGSLRWRTA